MLEDLIKWVNEKPNTRSVSIKIRENTNPFSLLPRISIGQAEVTIFAYDSELGVGQFVTSAQEIDLKKVKEVEEYQKYLELKKKYEIA
ncbi:MAG: hypothetical protein ACPLQO_02345 [Desulfotomaculales bacterium]